MKIKINRLIAIGILLFAPFAWGDDFPEVPDAPSAFVNVIHAREYDDRFESVEDLLHHAAGVRVRRFGGLGSHSTASIRGANAQQVLVLLDGVRLNTSDRGEVDLSSIAVRSLEKIEVIRGSGSARYGSDAVGGVIKLTSRRAEPDDSVDISGTSGSLETWGGDASIAKATHQWNANVNFNRLQSENQFQFTPIEAENLVTDHRAKARLERLPKFGRYHRLNADFAQNSGLARFEWSRNATSSISGTANFFEREGGQPGDISGAALPGATDESIGCNHATEDKQRALLSLAWNERQWGNGAFQAQGFHRYNRRSLYDEGGFCFLPIELGDQRTQSIDTSSGVEFSYAGRPTKLGPVYLSGRSATTVRYDTVRADDSEAKHRWVGSFFLQEEVRALKGRLRFFPALGFETAKTSEGLGRSASFSTLIKQEVEDESVFLPRIGMILGIANGLRLKSNYQRAYRRPNFTELFHPDYGFVRGNPTLQPEDSWNFDVGLEFARESLGPLRQVRTEVVYFDRSIEDSIEWIQNEGSGRTLMPQNTGPADVSGYELKTSATVFEYLDLAANYTRTDSNVAATGSELVQTPEDVYFASAAIRLGPAKLWLEFTRESEILLDRFNIVHADAFAQWDLGISAQLSELPFMSWVPRGLEVSSEWINLTDQARIDSWGLPLPDSKLWYLRFRLAPR